MASLPFVRAVRLGSLGAIVVGSSAAACGTNDSSSDNSVPLCLEKPADATCTNVIYGIHNGQISPTFSEIFTNTLKPGCGSNASCHSGPNPQNGLSLDDEATAYANLMKKNAAGTNDRVKPGDLKCGELIVRLETPNESWSMPKGDHLPEGLLCVIRHWIADGAKP